MPQPKEAHDILMAQNVRKVYGRTTALDDGNITLKAGCVHALLGENGAGKSTFVRILSGIEKPGTGEIKLNGKKYSPSSILEAHKKKVSTAFQELSLIPSFSVANNLLMPYLNTSFLGMVDRKKNLDKAFEILSKYNLERIDPRVKISELSLAERQRLEILRAILNSGNVLILDEPTSSLSNTDWLFEQINNITSKGTAVLYISHKLLEVREICQSATIFRNGKAVSHVALENATDKNIFKLMVGRDPNDLDTKVLSSTKGSVKPKFESARLKVANLYGDKVKGLNFSIYPGEVLGIAALDGHGQHDIFHILSGLKKPNSGQISLDDKEFKIRSPKDAMRIGSGVVYLPEERKTEGIFEGMSTASNVSISMLRKFWKRFFITAKKEINISKKVSSTVELQSRYLGFRIMDLSGGNQQKALIARVLATNAKTLLLFDPTRGVDVGTKETIYSVIDKFSNEGGSVLLYSSELSELIRITTRCFVLYQGRIIHTYLREEMNEPSLVASMSGYEQ